MSKVESIVVPSDRGSRVVIELFTGPACANCANAKERVSRVVRRLDSKRFELRVVDVVDEIDHAVAMGVLATPSIAINGVLVFSSAPPMAKIERVLRSYLSD